MLPTSRRRASSMPLPAEESEHLDARAAARGRRGGARVRRPRARSSTAVVETVGRGGALRADWPAGGGRARAAPGRHAGPGRPQGRQDGRHRPRRRDDGRGRDPADGDVAHRGLARRARARPAAAIAGSGLPISSAKQCGRAVVPPIAERHSFAEVMGDVEALRLPGPALMLVEPGASPGRSRCASLADVAMPPAVTRSADRGPEGGWTPQEVGPARARRAGWCRWAA